MLSWENIRDQFGQEYAKLEGFQAGVPRHSEAGLHRLPGCEDRRHARRVNSSTVPAAHHEDHGQRSAIP